MITYLRVLGASTPVWRSISKLYVEDTVLPASASTVAGATRDDYLLEYRKLKVQEPHVLYAFCAVSTPWNNGSFLTS